MATGSSSDSINKAQSVRGRPEVGTVEPKVGAFVPRRDHNPRELKSWAKRTGFVSNFSGETVGSSSGRNESGGGFDLERGGRGGSGSSPKIEIDPVLGRTKPTRGVEIEAVGVRSESEEAMRVERRGRRSEDEPVLGRDEERSVGSNGNGVVGGGVAGEAKKLDEGNGREGMQLYEGDGREGMQLYEEGEEGVHGGWGRPSAMRIGLRENPGFVPLIYYGLQHYLSLAGSLIFIPLIIVPAMGGTDKDTATVISTMLLVSGITTILHSYFGTRLPLVQGSSFVYLAPALVIINAQEYRNLTEHKFRHIMRELQGAIIVGSIFQSILGFSGLMSLLLRLINPIVVAPTVAAVGLAFLSYGFPQAGSCVEISIPQILLVLIFTLYLRGVSIFGHRLFRIYAVPLSIVIIWTYAFFLTAGGAYDYKGCTSDIPSSNILIDACRRHAYTMKHCRTDVSNAWRTAAWVRIPYPLQWGIPIFHFRTSIIMIFVSLVASVDSVGTYHSASMQINLKAPTRGIVSRGIALEGFCSILAGLWGSGTGSTTLTENIHTINITKVASRRVVELGAVFLIFFSFVGKVGAILASIPLALAASVLCFTWALVVALGLSTLQYSRAASFRNMMIVGVSLFLGLSIPAYFQQYQPESSFILPSYFIPYAAASNGPARTGSKQLDFAINALMSLNMVVTLMVALVLENTVPGSRQERGVYIWSKPEDINTDPSSLEDYSLPRKVSRCLCRSSCLGV
ncbi:PREDICTED: nucleobase-ascorbate transporter 11 [Fragaria vesca subsp. vesca]|uniref:nucleobase-ascorbate transporter 11 n=1 Tax=Fragaria vesca subsp. vesca TaxID=101020 RepID=UPI0002C303DA|nr:PREDICTED: nucleobase-ascorbate transporter 11 [Fragaria vesca subsp. vesca]